MHAMEISRTGLDVEWRRMEVIAENLANASTVRSADGSLYQARTLVSGPRGTFHAHLAADPAGLDGVEVYSIDAGTRAPRLVHDPANPQADANGMVAYPDIDHAGQMALMVRTARAYEANIVAMNMGRDMYEKALEIGGRP
jgi:flagellar basal-body rod protein FlgC